MEKSFPRFGYPNLDSLMASAERGFAGNFDFLFSHAVKNDLRRVSRDCRTLAREGLPALRLADAFLDFSRAVVRASAIVSGLMLEQEMKGAADGNR